MWRSLLTMVAMPTFMGLFITVAKWLAEDQVTSELKKLKRPLGIHRAITKDIGVKSKPKGTTINHDLDNDLVHRPRAQPKTVRLKVNVPNIPMFSTESEGKEIEGDNDLTSNHAMSAESDDPAGLISKQERFADNLNEQLKSASSRESSNSHYDQKIIEDQPQNIAHPESGHDRKVAPQETNGDPGVSIRSRMNIREVFYLNPLHKDYDNLVRQVSSNSDTKGRTKLEAKNQRIRRERLLFDESHEYRLVSHCNGRSLDANNDRCQL